MSGMHAIAAATFEGNPVDVDFGTGSGPALGGVGGGEGPSSGITYIHRMENALSSNLAFAALFAFPPCSNLISCPFIKEIPQMKKKYLSAFTLIELLVAIAIIIILVAIATPAFNTVLERGKVTKDLSNLRQIGLATQIYLNDNNGVLFTAGGIWMTQLHPKYLPAWKIFQSPFDKRAASELDANAPISYGLNGNPGSGSSIAGLSMDRITSPSVFIMFARAQA